MDITPTDTNKRQRTETPTNAIGIKEPESTAHANELVASFARPSTPVVSCVPKQSLPLCSISLDKCRSPLYAKYGTMSLASTPEQAKHTNGLGDVAAPVLLPETIRSEQYWYWKGDGGSYTEAELVQVVHGWRVKLLAQTPPPNPNTFVRVISPRGFLFTLHVDDLMKHDPRNLLARKHLILDVTRSAGETRCSLSNQPFHVPIILSLTGCTYSAAALKSAIMTSLCVGKPLCLKGCTLTPTMLPRVEYGFNYAFGVPLSATFSSLYDLPIQYTPKFDISAASCKSFAVIGRLLDCPTYKGDRVTYDLAMSRYDSMYEMPPGMRALNSYENLMVCQIIFPRGRLSTLHSFYNVLFSDMIILNTFPLCESTLHAPNLTFTACHFEGCTFVTSDACRAPTLYKHCEFHNCIFIQMTDKQISPPLVVSDIIDFVSSTTVNSDMLRINRCVSFERAVIMSIRDAVCLLNQLASGHPSQPLR